MKGSYVFILGIVILIAGIFIGHTIGYKGSKTIIENHTDTLIIRDTLSMAIPIPEIVYRDRVETVTLPAIIENDTVYVAVQVPIEKKIYETVDYRAVISGFKASLDSIDIFRQTQVINKVETIKIPDKKRWGIGVGLGYGAIARNGRVELNPYLGIGVQYNIIRF